MKPADVRTTLIERPITELIPTLSVGTIDAIFAPEQAATASAMSVPAWSEPLVALVPAAFAGKTPIAIGDLGLPLFLPDELLLPGFARQPTAILPGGLHFAASRFTSVATLYALVGTGHGVGVLPMSMAIASARVAVRSIRSKRARIAFWLTIRKVDDTPAVAILIEAVKAGLIRATPPQRADDSDEIRPA